MRNISENSFLISPLYTKMVKSAFLQRNITYNFAVEGTEFPSELHRYSFENQNTITQQNFYRKKQCKITFGSTGNRPKSTISNPTLHGFRDHSVGFKIIF